MVTVPLMETSAAPRVPTLFFCLWISITLSLCGLIPERAQVKNGLRREGM